MYLEKWSYNQVIMEKLRGFYPMFTIPYHYQNPKIFNYNMKYKLIKQANILLNSWLNELLVDCSFSCTQEV